MFTSTKFEDWVSYYGGQEDGPKELDASAIAQMSGFRIFRKGEDGHWCRLRKLSFGPLNCVVSMYVSFRDKASTCLVDADKFEYDGGRDESSM